MTESSNFETKSTTIPGTSVGLTTGAADEAMQLCDASDILFRFRMLLRSFPIVGSAPLKDAHSKAAADVGRVGEIASVVAFPPGRGHGLGIPGRDSDAQIAVGGAP